MRGAAGFPVSKQAPAASSPAMFDVLLQQIYGVRGGIAAPLVASVMPGEFFTDLNFAMFKFLYPPMCWFPVGW